MNTQMQVFNNSEFGALEVYEINGKPYFPATKCAELLGYKNPHKAIIDHCRGVTKREVGVQTGVKADGTPAMQETKLNIIPEGDVYRLIVRSNLPMAVRFEKWLFDEVVPTIRKHKMYATEDLLNDPDLLIKTAQALKDERARNAALAEKAAVQQQRIAEMQPKASYYDLILQCTGLLSITVIAKDYGKSGVWFNNYLHEIGVQYKVGDTWVLYQKYSELGLTHTKTHNYVNQKTGEPGAKPHTYWTQKGRLFLYDILKSHGMLPRIEQDANAGEDE